MTADDVARLFAADHAPVFRYLARLTSDPDRAADAAPEAFVRLIDHHPTLAVDPAALGDPTRAWVLPRDAAKAL